MRDGASARREFRPTQVSGPARTRLRWLRAVLEQMPSGVLVAEAPSGRVVFWNAQAITTWPDFLDAPDGARRCRAIRSDGRPYTLDDWPLAHALTSGAVVASEEVEFRGDDGARTVMDVRCVPVRDTAGRISAAVAIMQDITERKRAAQALVASQARYENLYQDAPDMFASVDVDTERLVQCNQTLVSVSGFGRDTLIGRPLGELHDEGSAPALARAIAQVGRTGRVHDTELRLRCKDGGVIDVSLTIAAIRDEQDHLYHRVTWRDVTERKRTHAALKNYQTELERSHRELHALAGRLFGAQEEERRRISRELHDDLNQRLALLTLDIEALSQKVPRSRRATTERLRAVRDRVVELSDDVHGLAYQLHPSILDDLGLAAALRSHIADVTRREGIAIELSEDGLTGPIPADVASCLYRVAQEALRNVVKHAQPASVTVHLDSSSDGVTMAVDDSGVGFDPRGTPHRGLGLVGMEERVRFVGGQFSLTSRPGEGTRVTVWVPQPGTAG